MDRQIKFYDWSDALTSGVFGMPDVPFKIYSPLYKKHITVTRVTHGAVFLGYDEDGKESNCSMEMTDVNSIECLPKILPSWKPMKVKLFAPNMPEYLSIVSEGEVKPLISIELSLTP